MLYILVEFHPETDPIGDAVLPIQYTGISATRRQRDRLRKTLPRAGLGELILDDQTNTIRRC